MRHRKEGFKFTRSVGQRRAFLRSLASNLIRHGKIETTQIRAKAIRPFVERLVTLAKKNTLAARRLLQARLDSKDAANRLVDEIAPRYKERPGGYLRIAKLGGFRKRDGAQRSSISFVE